jgi:hypothetical protein
LATRAAFLFLFVSYGFAFMPFSVEYRALNSVAPCFGLLLAAGWFLPKRPMLSVALLSASLLIRIPNAWLLPVVALPALFPEWFAGKPFAGLRPVVRRTVKVALAAFFCGILWLLLFQYLAMGSPLRTTYPYYDQSLASAHRVWENLFFYFSPQVGWLWVHLAALVLAGIVFCRKGARRWFLWVLALYFWNYAFYLTHEVQGSYYPFASSILALGLVLRGFENLPRRVLQISFAALTVLFALLIQSAWRPLRQDPTAPVPGEIAEWQKALAGADAVWAEYRSGTAEYATGIPGLRILWGSRQVRVEAVRWLYGHGYTQAVLLDDLGMIPEEVAAILDAAKVPQRIVTDEKLGRVLWIDPEAPAK